MTRWLSRTYRLISIPLLLLVSACSPDPSQSAGPLSGASPSSDLPQKLEFTSRPIGDAPNLHPWIAHLKAVDLNEDGLTDIIACDARVDTVFWIQQTAPGEFEEIQIAHEMRAPVHVEPFDIDQDGDLDLLVSCMSFIFPNNDKIGALIALENDGNENFTKRILLDNVDRVTDARVGDFDKDGLLDIAVGQFGYDQGEVRWMRQTAPWQFESHSLIKLSGTINVCLADYNEDGHLDIAAQISQQWEEIHLFTNNGDGSFSNRVIWGSTNEDYASSGMRICDLNQDGHTDLIFVNGDGFGPTPLPGPRPWHGVQWLENDGNSNFTYHRIGDLAGAYSPLPIDLDGDKDLDVVALSAFNTWSNPKAESFVWFENTGDQIFTRHVAATTPTHLLTVDAAPFGPNGEVLLATGGFHAYPPYDRISRILLWDWKEGVK